MLSTLLALPMLFGAPPADGAKAPEPKQLVVTIGRTVPLQMSTKGPIREAAVDNPRVLRIDPVANDPTTILLTGLEVGRTRLELKGADGKAEVWELGRPVAARGK